MEVAQVFVDAGSKLWSLSRGIYGQFIERLGKCIYGGVRALPPHSINAITLS